MVNGFLPDFGELAFAVRADLRLSDHPRERIPRKAFPRGTALQRTPPAFRGLFDDAIFVRSAVAVLHFLGFFPVSGAPSRPDPVPANLALQAPRIFCATFRDVAMLARLPSEIAREARDPRLFQAQKWWLVAQTLRESSLR